MRRLDYVAKSYHTIALATAPRHSARLRNQLSYPPRWAPCGGIVTLCGNECVARQSSPVRFPCVRPMFWAPCSNVLPRLAGSPCRCALHTGRLAAALKTLTSNLVSIQSVLGTRPMLPRSSTQQAKRKRVNKQKKDKRRRAFPNM